MIGDETLNRINELKSALGSAYSYERYFSDNDIVRLKKQNSERVPDTVIASLIVGCLKIEAVLFKGTLGLKLGYDVFVKDNPQSSDWIYFDSSTYSVSTSEADMLAALDKVAVQNQLSYTECCFERLNGKLINALKKEAQITNSN